MTRIPSNDDPSMTLPDITIPPALTEEVTEMLWKSWVPIKKKWRKFHYDPVDTNTDQGESTNWKMVVDSSSLCI